VNADLPAHHLHQLLADDQPESGAAVLAGGGGVGLRERLKQPRDLVRAHPDPRVNDAKSHGDLAVSLFLQCSFHRDFTAFGELYGVGGKIRQ
jgi:hypothetical protein